MQFGSCMTIVDGTQADVANDPLFADASYPAAYEEDCVIGSPLIWAAVESYF
jgi:hypothetical protein